MAIGGLESADDAASELIVADDGLVPLVRLVGHGVGRDGVDESKRNIVDDDVAPCSQHLRAYLDLNTGEDVIMITTRNGFSLNGPNDSEQLFRSLVHLWKTQLISF